MPERRPPKILPLPVVASHPPTAISSLHCARQPQQLFSPLGPSMPTARTRSYSPASLPRPVELNDSRRGVRQDGKVSSRGRRGHSGGTTRGHGDATRWSAVGWRWCGGSGSQGLMGRPCCCSVVLHGVKREMRSGVEEGSGYAGREGGGGREERWCIIRESHGSRGTPATAEGGLGGGGRRCGWGGECGLGKTGSFGL